MNYTKDFEFTYSEFSVDGPRWWVDRKLCDHSISIIIDFASCQQFAEINWVQVSPSKRSQCCLVLYCIVVVVLWNVKANNHQILYKIIVIN